MIDMDFTGVLRDALARDRRKTDGLLHPSGDLVGSLRHSMLNAVGATTIESQIVSDIRLRTGTMWHSYFESIFPVAVETEVSLGTSLPEGWSGTADWLFHAPKQEYYVLGDLKTCRGEAIKWLRRDGAKENHLWQLSAYFWALVEAGYPMYPEFVDRNDGAPCAEEG